MNSLAFSKIFVLALLVYAVCGNNVHKRETADDSSNSQSDDNLKKILSSIPVVGSLFNEAYEYGRNITKANITEQSIYLERAILEIVNNTLPCAITMQNVTCQGLKENGGMFKILINAFRGIPGGIFNGSPITKIVSLFDSERGSQLSQPRQQNQNSQPSQISQPILSNLKNLFSF